MPTESRGVILDRDRIKTDANAIIVAESLGIKIHHKGTKKMILCPSHADKKIGSCFINEGGYYCYSCGAKGDVFSLVQVYLNIDFVDAKKYVADICGGKKYYLSTGKSLHAGLIPKKDQKLIKLIDSPIYKELYYTYDKQEAMEFREDGYFIEEDDSYLDDKEGEDINPAYVVKKIQLNSPLHTLYRENIEQYRELIDRFCQAEIDRLDAFYDAFADIHTFEQRINEIINISKKHGNGKTKSKINMVAVLLNSIWDKELLGAF